MIEWDPFQIREAQFKDGHDSRLNSRPHDDDSILNEWPNTPGAKAFLGFTLNKRRLFLVLIVFGLAITVLLYRAFTLQIINGQYYKKIADGNRIRLSSIPASRGIIYDRNGAILTKNTAAFQLLLTPVDLPADPAEQEKIFDRVMETMGEKNIEGATLKDEIIQDLHESTDRYSPIVIRDNIDYNLALLAKIQSAQWPGFSVNIATLRHYKNDAVNSFSHILGYLGRVTENDLTSSPDIYGRNDMLGKTGLELSYEKTLRGTVGKEQVEVDVQGKNKKILAREAPKSGSDLILTIDEQMQAKMAEILQQKLTLEGKKRGTAIVIDPHNGEVLASVSLPSFNNNLFAKGISKDDYQALLEDPNLPMFNRAVSGEYPSGSTFKPVIASGALEEKLITANTTINSTGGIHINKFYFPDWKTGGHGLTNVTRALAWSVNTFFYIFGGGFDELKGLGVSKIIRYAQMYGFGSVLGVDMPAERPGFLPTPDWKERTTQEPWYIGDTYHLAIGQGGLLVTPLQLAVEIATLANGGTVYKPHYVKAFKDADSITTIAPQILNKDFISPPNMAIVREGLRQTVTYGSARSLSELSISSAGKTGTAQWKVGKNTHAWFTGFAPYNNPELAITVLIEEGGEGSSVCVPVVKEFYSWYFGTYKKSSHQLTSN